MSDKYLELVNSGVTKKIASALGLPRPTKLRRQGFDPTPIPLTGTVVVLGDGKDADTVANTLLQWDVDVRRSSPPQGQVQAIIPVFTQAQNPGEVHDSVLETGSLLRKLAPHGRIITISRDPHAVTETPASATQAGVEGFLRSLAKEMRRGATANGIVIGADVGVGAPAVASALNFFLSPRSAFIAGQVVHVSSRRGKTPASWDRPLEGQVALVTGAARGIGAAIARVLARDGAHVLGVDVPAAGEELAQVMNMVGGTALQLDITAPEAPTRMITLAKQRLGRLDVVVHNAGVLRDKMLANMSDSQWQTVVEVNLTAQLRITEQMMKTTGLSPDGLRVITLASTSGIAGNRGQTNYAFTKGGVMGMVESLAPKIAEAGGTINAVAPGFIETEMTASIPLLTRQVARRLNSLQQGGLPVDVAEAIAFLVAPSSRGVNGETLRVCGQNLVGK